MDPTPVLARDNKLRPLLRRPKTAEIINTCPGGPPVRVDVFVYMTTTGSYHAIFCVGMPPGDPDRPWLLSRSSSLDTYHPHPSRVRPGYLLVPAPCRSWPEQNETVHPGPPFGLTLSDFRFYCRNGKLETIPFEWHCRLIADRDL